MHSILLSNNLIFLDWVKFGALQLIFKNMNVDDGTSLDFYFR